MAVPTTVRPALRGVKQPACAASKAPARGTGLRWLLGGLLAVGLSLSSVARADLALSVDSIVEVSSSPSVPVPQVGSTSAAISVDVTGTIGGVCPAPLLRSLVRRLSDVRDVRLRFYPLRSVSERGEELLLTACQQRPSQCVPFLLELCAHPAWFAGSSVAELSDELWSAASRLGLSVPDLQTSLRVHRQRRALRSLWEGPLKNQLLSDVRVNSKRIIGSQVESRLFDELDLQRERAAEALRSGVTPASLHEHLMDPRRDRDDDRRSLARFSPSSFGRLREPPRHPESVEISLSGLPCQGPEITPTTVVFVFHHEQWNAGAQARAVFDVWSSLRDRVRLCMMLAPVSPSARRVSELLGQVAAVDSHLYFRVLDDLLDVMTRRLYLRYEDVVAVLRRRGDLAKVESKVAQGRLRIANDRAQLQLLDLQSASYVIIGNRVVGSWSRDTLLSDLTKETRRGLLERLRQSSVSAKK